MSLDGTPGGQDVELEELLVGGAIGLPAVHIELLVAPWATVGRHSNLSFLVPVGKSQNCGFFLKEVTFGLQRRAGKKTRPTDAVVGVILAAGLPVNKNVGYN